MAKSIFKEKQRYSNKLILGILSALCLVTIIGGVKFLLEPQANYSKAIFLLILSISTGIFIWGLTKLKLKVSISKKAIKFKMSPIHVKKHSIQWEDIERCEIIRTPEAAQWSGGNICFNHEKRISLTGRNGLSIKTKEDEYYFIGIRKIEELKEVLKKLYADIN